jgi:hypothetical protein
MALFRRCSLLAAPTIVVTVPTVAAQGATPPAGRPICLSVSATGVGQDLGGGNTQATISIHGVEVGRTNASFTTTQVVVPTASFTGPIVFSSPPGNANRTGRRHRRPHDRRLPSDLHEHPAPGYCAGLLDA